MEDEQMEQEDLRKPIDTKTPAIPQVIALALLVVVSVALYLAAFTATVAR